MATKVLRELDELSLAGMVRRLRASRDLAEPEPETWTGNVAPAVHALAIISNDAVRAEILMRDDWGYLRLHPDGDRVRVVVIGPGLGNDRPRDSFLVEEGRWTP